MKYVHSRQIVFYKCKFISFCSIFVCSALGNILGKFGVPYLTFPFNLLAIVTFLSLQTIYPAVPTEDKNNLSYNCSLLETQFKVNKKMNENFLLIHKHLMVYLLFEAAISFLILV